MEYAIFLNSVLPVRAEARESSEMVTQLLFGEFCSVVEKKDSFCLIKNYFDGYSGWVDEKMLSGIDEETFIRLSQFPVFRTVAPMADVFCLTDKTIYRLSAGSVLPFYDYEKSTFEIAGKTFQIHSSFVTYLPESSKTNLLEVAKLFLNTPYLWGGKNILGTDCSGFVQVVYSLSGFLLPRDAYLQEREGEQVSSLSEAEPTDLLFFEKNGKITHVGIYTGESKVIHASGKVRIDKVDERGIYNEDISSYTHRLVTIKRI